ncbi:hypothetical protein BDW62DRAFT_201944 [Aspergillus aurantiobrunneus]
MSEPEPEPEQGRVVEVSVLGFTRILELAQVESILLGKEALGDLRVTGGESSRHGHLDFVVPDDKVQTAIKAFDSGTLIKRCLDPCCRSVLVNRGPFEAHFHPLGIQRVLTIWLVAESQRAEVAVSP